MLDLHETFEKFNDDYIKFDLVKDKLHRLPDVCAFILLDKLVPSEKDMDMVSAAEHDVIYLNTDCDKLAEVATEDNILTLTRCGVFYDSDVDSLSMFV